MAKFFTPSKISENIRETPEGFLVCIGVPIARTGWQDYGPNETPLEPGDDGRVWIYRDPKEVFHPRTIASFQGKSVTIRHPDDFVDPSNWKHLSHGIAQNIRRGGTKDEDGEEPLLADLLITNDIAIGLVKQGLREVSCGYDAEYEETGHGTGKQTNIIGNHVALVEEGRAGPSYAIRDHKDQREETIMSDVLKELADQLKKLGKTVDTALAAKTPPKKKKTEDSETEDAEESEKKMSFDDVMDAMKAISDKVDGIKVLSGDKKGKDSDEGEESDQDSRLSALEAAVAKILKSLGAKKGEDESEEEESEDESEEEESEDESEDESEEEESEDESEEEESEDDLSGGEEGEEGESSQSKKKTGDAARVEILTPGKSFKGKDARVKCLKSFASTKDGAKVLSQVSGKKKPTIDSKSADHLFLAASAVMKSKRGVGLSGTKDSRGACAWGDGMDAESNSGKVIGADDINEMNAKHYGLKK